MHNAFSVRTMESFRGYDDSLQPFEILTEINDIDRILQTRAESRPPQHTTAYLEGSTSPRQVMHFFAFRAVDLGLKWCINTEWSDSKSLATISCLRILRVVLKTTGIPYLRARRSCSYARTWLTPN